MLKKNIIIVLLLSFSLSYISPVITYAEEVTDIEQSEYVEEEDIDPHEDVEQEDLHNTSEELEIEEELESVEEEDNEDDSFDEDISEVEEEEGEEFEEQAEEEIDNLEELQLRTSSVEQDPLLTYRAHVQSIGWQDWQQSGETAGTSGQGLRVEAFSMEIDHPNLGIRYRSRVQDSDNWSAWAQNGENTGTTGQARHIEALQIELTGSEAANYDIYYRVHSRAFGWLDWARNGESSGTEGYNYRIEAVEIQLVPRGAQAPGGTSQPYQAIQNPELSYSAHVQSIGWQNNVNDGQLAGTSGQGLRVEALRLNVNHPQLGIRYRSRAQGADGWSSWAKDGASTGTTGQGRHLEALQIELTGEMSNHFDVYYRVHAQSVGWLSWARRGEAAGTEGYNFRIEAVEVRVVPRMNNNMSQSGESYLPIRTPNINYSAHVQSNGWMNQVSNGTIAGTSGQRLRMEAMQISLSDMDISGGIEYRTHVQGEGWQDWRRDGAITGTTGRASRLEAIEIRLYGQVANHFDVYYRTHIESFGWLGWVNNGLPSGSEGLARRMEAIEIELVPKGQGRAVNPNDGFREPLLVYIDPGHGGRRQPGAVYGGIREADLNLQTARRLNSILISRGYKTHMSRNSDTEVSLSERAQEANNMNADIFVSVHFNAHPTQTVQGIETYIYNQRGNTSNPYANNTDRINNSRTLANHIQSQLINQTGATNRGVREANFHVIRETHMPAVLLELGFMDHPQEWRQIQVPSYQNTLSRAVAAGIDQYFNR